MSDELRWIPVTEALPNEGEPVLLSDGGELLIASLDRRGRWMLDDYRWLGCEPDAWMRIPKYKKESEK